MVYSEESSAGLVGLCYTKFIYVDGPKGSRKRCILIRGGFSTGDRFEFGSVDQQVRNRGINPWWKLTQDPPVATQSERTCYLPFSVARGLVSPTLTTQPQSRLAGDCYIHIELRRKQLGEKNWWAAAYRCNTRPFHLELPFLLYPYNISNLLWQLPGRLLSKVLLGFSFRFHMFDYRYIYK